MKRRGRPAKEKPAKKTKVVNLVEEDEPEAASVTFSNPGVIEVSGNSAPHLVSTSGNSVVIEGLTVSTSGYYDCQSVQATVKAIDGCFYYEAKILQTGSMRLGWGSDTVSNPTRRNGLGADADSWGWDGSDLQRYHNSQESHQRNYSENQYGESWKVNDVIGCLVDFENRKISYSRNGRPLGAAWTDFKIKAGGGLHPCMSISYGGKATFNFGPNFVYKPRAFFGMNPSVTDKQRSQIQDVFHLYQEKGVVMNESQCLDLMKMKGVWALGVDLGATDPMHPHLLVLAWKLRSKKFFEFYDTEWSTLWALEQVFTFADMKKFIETCITEIRSNPDTFNAFYRFTFDYLLKEKGDKATAIEKHDAIASWNMLQIPAKWSLFPKWVQFWDGYYMKGVTRDTWCMLLTVIDKIGADLSKFDDADCWPLAIDDFFDFLKNPN